MDRRTVEYYDSHTEEYVARTAGADLTQLHDRFLAHIPRGGRVLDFGCGFGRDMHAFQRRGYDVVGLDPSSEMITIASRVPGAECHLGDVFALRNEARFDGIWACASLVHVAKTEMVEVMKRLVSWLAPCGVLYFSVRSGTSEHRMPDGRLYSDYNEREVAQLMQKFPGFETQELWLSSDSDASRTEITWINWLGVKSVQSAKIE